MSEIEITFLENIFDENGRVYKSKMRELYDEWCYNDERVRIYFDYKLKVYKNNVLFFEKGGQFATSIKLIDKDLNNFHDHPKDYIFDELYELFGTIKPFGDRFNDHVTFCESYELNIDHTPYRDEIVKTCSEKQIRNIEIYPDHSYDKLLRHYFDDTDKYYKLKNNLKGTEILRDLSFLNYLVDQIDGSLDQEKGTLKSTLKQMEEKLKLECSITGITKQVCHGNTYFNGKVYNGNPYDDCHPDKGNHYYCQYCGYG